jgi:hypothetical protein
MISSRAEKQMQPGRVIATGQRTKGHEHLKRLRVVSVAVARKVAWGGGVGVLERHVMERWSGVGLKVPERDESVTKQKIEHQLVGN